MSKSTIYYEACNQVVGFQQMGDEFTRKLVINNKAKSTHENYLRQMSKLALYYKRSPLELEIGELEEYLYYLIQKDTDALSSYKHLVYGLRKLYLLFGKDELHLSLPSIKHANKLLPYVPLVLQSQFKKRPFIKKTYVHVVDISFFCFFFFFVKNFNFVDMLVRFSK